MVFDEKHIESVINQIYPGLTMYVRDTNLPKNVSEKYEIRNNSPRERVL